MSKYIIDTDQFEKLFETKAVAVLGIGDNLAVPEEGEKTVWTRMLNVADLEELNSDYINEHFGQLQDVVYQKGFEDGKWKSEDGCTGCKYEGKTGEHLPCDYCMNNFKNQWTAKDDKIEVGDVVRLCRHKVPYIVTSCDGDDDTYILMTVNGGFIKSEKYNVHKMGRHFDIASILEEMRHD
jgi:hypothetical protein